MWSRNRSNALCTLYLQVHNDELYHITKASRPDDIDDETDNEGDEQVENADSVAGQSFIDLTRYNKVLMTDKEQKDMLKGVHSSASGIT